MTRKATFTQEEVKRAVRAAQSLGLEIVELVVERNHVRLVVAGAAVDTSNQSVDKCKPKEWPT